MAIHSSSLAWRVPWTEEPGRPQSIGLQRVGHDWATEHAMQANLLNLCLGRWHHIIVWLCCRVRQPALCPRARHSLSLPRLHYNTIWYCLFLKMYRRVREPWRPVAQHKTPWPWGIFCTRFRRHKWSSSHLLCIIVMLVQSTSKY